MADRSKSPGGLPFDQYAPVEVDNETIQGNGTPTAPLSVVEGALAISVDDVTIGGTGKEASPLHAIFTGFYDNVKVVADGSTIIGTGITGDPLIATGGAPGSVFVQPWTYTVTGLEPDPANITITITPGQPDGSYQLAVTQSGAGDFLALKTGSKTGANFVLSLSADAVAGQEFDIVLTRAP